MLTAEELYIFCLTLIVLWIFPIFKLSKTRPKILILNFLFQLFYSAFYLWLLENYGNKGSSLLWLFYWFITIIIHLIGLNIWTLTLMKKNKNAR